MNFKFLSPVGILWLILLFFINKSPQKFQPENSAPQVKIIKPDHQSTFRWNSFVPYQINIVDEEDGNSDYDEIEKSAVLLEVHYFPEGLKESNHLVDRSPEDRNMLFQMSKSNCLTCHAASTKLIGPAFDLIARRYTAESKVIDTLAKKLIAGSKGTWGEVPMPAHPDLGTAEARAMVQWILNFDKISNYTFYMGTEGAFKTKEKEADGEQGVYHLIASYRDRGEKDRANSSKEGQSRVIITSKP